MKFLLILLLLLSSQNLLAADFEIQNPCSDSAFAEGNLPIQNSTILEFTKLVLKKFNLNNETSENGILSIENFVANDKKLEIISDSKMRAYGWCFSINGSIPDLMPDQIVLNSNDRLKWFLAYSTYDRGNWIDYCKEVAENKESQNFICN